MSKARRAGTALFRIEPDGHVRDRKYGGHAYDRWTVDELLARAGAGPVR